MDMKKVVVLLCVALMGAGTFAYTLMGPPTAELKAVTGQKEGNYREDRHGYTFSYSEMDIGIDGIGTLEDLELMRHYYTWDIALDENFNFGILLGAVAGKTDLAPGLDLDGDYKFSWGFNFKSTFHHGEKMDLGAMVQMTWFGTEDNIMGVDVELEDVYDLQVAVGPTVDMGGWDLYGGAFYYMLDGDLTLSVPAFGFSISTGIEEDDEFGGFIGAKFDIAESTDFIVEYLQGNDSFGIGFSIGKSF